VKFLYFSDAHGPGKIPGPARAMVMGTAQEKAMQVSQSHILHPDANEKGILTLCNFSENK
jgi:hypothetical protein